MSSRYRIPVPGAALPPRGASGSWLYERSSTHYHQGLDIGGRYGGGHPVYRDRDSYHAARKAGKLEIRSVTAGTVVKIIDKNDEGGESYGRVIVIKSTVNGRTLWFLYAHLAPYTVRLTPLQDVQENEVIAYVGHSGNAGAANPHLHFEVATKPLPTGAGPDHETTPTKQRIRIDPYHVLEELGPFSAKKAFFVTGDVVTPTGIDAKHKEIETSPRGGFFPLGANNIWHGGVHMPAAAGSKLVAPFDGEIVAVRLDPNPATASRAFGSCNFVLMRHELPEPLYKALRAEKGGNVDPAFVGPEAPGVDEDLEGDASVDDHDDHEGGCCGDHPDPPDKDEPEKPDPPPPEVPENPERVVYSLLMHVGSEPFTDALATKFPWLSAVRVDAGSIAPPPGAQEAKTAFTEHEEDATEADGHRITSKVGGGQGKPVDIEWVEKRLIRFELLDEATGVEREALTEAIKAFQVAHVFPKTPSKANGIVQPNGKTDTQLRKTRRALGLDPTPAGPKTIDPMFVARAGNLDADGAAEVISGLRIPVRAGEALWESDRARGFEESGSTSLQDQVHWEIFSEEKIFIDGVDGWGSIDDPNEDLTTDAPQALIDLIDKPTASFIPTFSKGPDGIVSLAELTAFYATPEAVFLRRRQCRFRAEWGLDLDATIDALVKTFPNIDSFRDDLVPYQWWDKAGLTKTHVWHYNPIEFVGLYQRGLDALAPPPKKDPRKFGDVRVIVTNKQGGRLGRVKLKLVDAAGTKHEAKTKGPDWQGRGGGEVTFYDVAKGTAKLSARYSHQKTTWEHPESALEVAAAKKEDDPFVLTEVALAADVDGDPPPRGKINVTVMRGGKPYKPEVVVQVVDASSTVVKEETTSSSKVKFGDLPFGKYVVRSKDGESDVHNVEIDRKSARAVTLARYRDPAKLKVRVIHGGVGVEGVEVSANATPKNPPAVGRYGVTDPSGDVIFDVFEGPYTVKIGKVTKTKNVVAGKLNELIVTMKSPPPPTLTGILAVEVPAIGNNADNVVELCRASHPDFVVLTEVPKDGMAEFVTAPGDYIARFGDGAVKATVTAGSTTHVKMEPK